MLNNAVLAKIEQELKTKRIGILGDFCLDIYWRADMRLSELSRETPHYPLPVTEERISLGAAGNVAANLAALGPASVSALALVGDDWRGAVLKDCAAACGIDTGLFLETPGRFTNAYCKPYRRGISDTVYEDPRLDFENRAPVSEAIEAQILERLETLASHVDVLCVADQFACGIVTPEVRAAVCLLAKAGLPVVVDSRASIGSYTHCILKPNELECRRAVRGNGASAPNSVRETAEDARMLAERNSAFVFCTLGADGACLTDGLENTFVPAFRVAGPIDICGAGDTSISAFSCALACGVSYQDAALFAAAASAVTIRKLGQTGTATLAEIAEML